ncbi:MAG: hypothetical protein ABH950_03915 [Candidatus Altiarchaeota archaeon]
MIRGWWILSIVFLVQFTSAYDLALEVTLPENVSVNSTYEDLFKITNLDHQTSVKENLTASVDYTITFLDGNSSTKENFTVTGLASWKTSETGIWTPTKVGEYRIEGRITNSFENSDTNPSNDLANKTITVHSTSNIPCEWDVEIQKEKDDFAIKEPVSWKFKVNCTNCTGLPENLIVSYWVKDETGEIIKEKKNWSGLNIQGEETSTKRTWTPQQSGNYTLNAEIVSISCRDEIQLNNKAYEEISVLFKNSNQRCAINLTIPQDTIYDETSYLVNVSTNVTDSHNIQLKSWVEDFFGKKIQEKEEFIFLEDEKEIVRFYWNPGKTTGTEAYIIRAETLNPGCRVNQSNVSTERIVVVVGERPRPENRKSNSEIEFNIRKNKTYEWDETIDARVNVYRGSTSKRNVKIWIEDNLEKKVSETSSFNIETKYVKTEFVIPVFLKNPGRNLTNTYFLKAEGLGEKDICEIKIKGLTSEKEESNTIKKPDSSTTSDEENPKLPGLEIVDYPAEAGSDGFQITIEVDSGPVDLNGTLTSYIYNGTKLLSEGFKGTEWKKAWNANEIFIKQNRKETKKYTLKNRIVEGTPKGTYKIKAKLVSENKILEDLQDIRVLEETKKHILEQPTEEPAIKLPSHDPKDNSSKKELTSFTGKTINPLNKWQPPKLVILIKPLLLVTIFLIIVATLSFILALSQKAKKNKDVSNTRKPPRTATNARHPQTHRRR